MTDKLKPLDKFIVLHNDSTTALIAVSIIIPSNVMRRQGLPNHEYLNLLRETMPQLTDWLDCLQSKWDVKMTFIMNENFHPATTAHCGVAITLYNQDDITAFLLSWTTENEY